MLAVYDIWIGTVINGVDGEDSIQRWGSEKEKLWWGQWSTDAAPNAEDTFFFATTLVPSYWKQ
jgi:hypothetical protein